ncbi:MAG: N-acetyltransferase [Treponema sp.]
MNEALFIQPAKMSDIDPIMRIFECARRFMNESGNSRQWEADYPSKELLERDIQNGNLYTIADGREIHGVFALIAGIDPTYSSIDGAWLNDEPYATIHRIASDGKIKGIFDTAVGYAKLLYENLRIDTHEDNKVMRRLIEKNNFQFCGTIRIEQRPACPEQDTKRLAYHWKRAEPVSIHYA